MEQNEKFVHIGQITKQRGTRGEVEIRFTDADAFEEGAVQYVMLRLEGLLVPFFWEEYRFKNNDTAIVEFEDVTTPQQAAELVGAEVYYDAEALPESDGVLASLQALRGFRVYAPEMLGEITAVDDSTMNTLLYIRPADGGNEMILPYHDDFLENYDLKLHTLTLQLPFDIEDLNS